MDNIENMQNMASPEAVEKKPETSVGKRVGYFFLAILPAVACLIGQLVIGLVYMIVIAVVDMVGAMGANPGMTQNELMDIYYQSVMNSSSGAVFLYHLISLPLFGIWYYFGCGRPKLKKSLHNVGLKAAALSVLGGIVLSFVSNSMVGVETFVIPDMVQQLSNLMELAGVGVTPLAMIATVVLAPIGEEILCRGLILHYGKKSLPKFWMANILQAAMFGFIHFNLVQGLYVFVIGLFLGYLAERFHSLLPCMLLHFVINFSATVWFDGVFNALVPNALWAYALVFIVSTALVFVLVWWGGSIKKTQTNVNS